MLGWGLSRVKLVSFAEKCVILHYTNKRHFTPKDMPLQTPVPPGAQALEAEQRRSRLPGVTLENPCALPEADFIKSHGRKLPVDCVNWPGMFPYAPRTNVWVAYTPQYLLCHWEVAEQQLLGRATETNGPVWDDSCVEAFIADPDGRHYYNVEINCLGTALCSRRLSQKEFELYPPQQVDRILRRSSLPAEPCNLHAPADGPALPWSLTVAIPWDMLGRPGGAPVGESIRANFYKGGEKTDTPHFVSWSPILTMTPNFHTPEYFGELALDPMP